jgi:hypothetical protein
LLASLADLYVNTADTIVEADLTISPANLAKFRSGGKPVDLGANGSTPTGSAPLIFLSGDASQWPNNAAGSGAFSTRRIINTTGHNGAGSVTASGAVAGEAVKNVVDWFSGADVSSDFETTISVNGQIQQTGSANYSTHRIVVSLSGALTNATTSPSD